MAEAVLNTIASSVFNATPLLASARNAGNAILRHIETETPTDSQLLRLGCQAHHWMALCGYTDVEKYPIIEDRVKESWFVVSTSQEFTDYAKRLSVSKLMLSPTGGPRYWNRPRYQVDGHIIPLVKSAHRYELLDNYTDAVMPDFYDVMNRLNRQTFKINQYIYKLITTDFPFIPRIVPEDERRDALHSLNDISRNTRYIQERQFEEMNKWLLDQEVGQKTRNKLAYKKAAERSSDYYDEKSEPHMKTISDWSKRMDFERIRQLSTEWKTEDINFLYQADSRGRIYTVQNYLTPLGSDLAKAMLTFNEYHQISGFDLCIHIANCFGKDKWSFEERVSWVNENTEDLYAIGYDPMANYSLIQKLSLDAERKTKWQGISACIEYRRFIDYVKREGAEDGFLSNIIIGLDATASGTQILTMLGRDHKVAPFVNVSDSTTGRVGDFYTYLSRFLKPKLEVHRGQSDTLDTLLDNYDNYARILAKRNSMTFSYSGTKWGFGKQQWEDRHDYDKGPTDTTGSDLTRKDCRIIGNEMYDVCVENIRGGAEVMEWLREGIDLHANGAIISWTLPDGFIAFQVCDRGKPQSLEATIGTRKVALKYYSFQDIPAKREHKNGISPNWVHSFDAYLLRLIVRNMPIEAPISTVHDQFSTSSYYIEDLQNVAREAYKTVANREVAEKTCEEAFGIYRELPVTGHWTTDELDNAEFFIC